MANFTQKSQNSSSPERHGIDPGSLGGTDSMISRWAHESAPAMDKAVKARQRAAILTYAEHMSPEQGKAHSVQPASRYRSEGVGTPEASSRWRWLWLSGPVAAVAVVAVFVMMIQFPGITPQSGSSVPFAVPRLRIPEAHAGDAFSLSAEKQDAAGIAVDTGFVMKATVAVTTEEIKQSLRVVPAIDFDVEKVSDTESKIVPKQALDPGTVYKVVLATDVSKTDGSLLQRDFSWALQTKNDFRVLSSIPGDGGTNVPVNTGIEFKLTQDGWDEPAAFFSIVPAVKGKFETHGRTLVFVPAKPLSKGVRYEVTLKKAFGIKNSDQTLPKDVKVRFETAVDESVYGNKPTLSVGEFVERMPGVPIEFDVQMYRAYDQPVGPVDLDVVGYRLSKDDARGLMASRAKIPAWAPVQREKFAEYKNYAKTEAFRLKTTIQRSDSYSPLKVSLPAMDAPGWYAVHLTSPSVGNEAWLMVQVTNIAAYMTADKDTMLVWAVNAALAESRPSLSVTMDGTRTVTDAQGLARVSAPAFLADKDKEPGEDRPFSIVELTDGKDTALEVVQHSAYRWRPYFWESNEAFATTWGYVYTDRPLYRNADTVHIFGVAQDRASRQGVGTVQVRLNKTTMWLDMGTGTSKAYKTADLTTDAAGRFSGELSWTDLSPGYYQVTVLREGKTLASRSFEVRAFAKPSYFLDVKVDNDRVYAGNKITGTVRASFYDGTAVPKTALSVAVQRGFSGQNKTVEVVTDQLGVARFTLDTVPMSCEGERPQLSSCFQQDYASIIVRPSLGEEGEITGTAEVTVYTSELSLETTTRVDNNTAYLTILGRHRDFSKESGLGNGYGGRAVRGEIVGEYWEKIEKGTAYDFIEKRSYPTYQYVKRQDAPVLFSLMTDANGGAVYPFPITSNREYRVTVWSADDTQRMAVATAYVGSWYGRGLYEGMSAEEPRLALIPKNEFGEFALDERVSVQYQHGVDPLNVEKTPGVLFYVASRGIKSAEAIKRPDYSFALTNELVPNAQIYAVTYWHGKFEVVTQTVSLKKDTRALDVVATTDQATYAPGADVRVHVKVTRRGTDEGVRNAKVAIASVDKAIDGVVKFTDENPLSSLYGYVPDGLLYERMSHAEYAADFGLERMMGGAEKGGGGGDYGYSSMRKIFKDTAAFQVIDLDQNGEGNMLFKAPDNLTSWRTEVVAITPDLYAGAVNIDIPVTKQVFVEAVVPARLLVTDKPILKLRAFGVSVKADTAVSFKVDAPTLGVNNQLVDGKAEAPVYLALGQLAPGRHTVKIGVQTSAGNDAFEREVVVAGSRFMKDELVTIDPAPGSTLPDLGMAEADVYITSKERGQYLSSVQSLAYGDSARVDARVAARLMQKLMKDVYRSEEELPEVSVADYQDGSGGIKLLPYGGLEVGLSADIAATSLEGFDRKTLAQYFWYELDRRDATREMRVSALSGLASLSEPVLPMLKTAAEQTDLTWREQLLLARGMVAVGDLEAARKLLDTLMQKAEVRDQLVRIVVSSKEADVYEATAEAASIAVRLGDARADGMRLFVERNWNADAFPVLARARFLSAMVPTLGADGTFSYSLNGKDELFISLKDQPVTVLTLTREEAAQFRAVTVASRVSVSFVRRTPGKPASAPEVAISRSYKADHAMDQLVEGELVRVTLKPTWKKTAQEGCYVVHDRVPGGMEPVMKWTSDLFTSNTYYPTQVQDGEVSFVACKSPWFEQNDITYVVRTVSRGTYTAEAPSIQHMEFPSIGATGVDQVVIVK
ncbi:MAG: Ig-like domain-containing protein [Patescibacteria group bacterium]